MSFPARDNQITFGAIVAWFVVIVLAVVVLFLVFKTKGPDAPESPEWSTESYDATSEEKGEFDFPRIADMEWLLITLSFEGEAYELSDEVSSTIRIDATGRFGGNGGCNNFFGQFEHDADSGETKTGPIGSTMMACPPPKGMQEGAYLRALEQVTRLALDDHKLFLRNADASTELIFALIFPEEMGAAEEEVEPEAVEPREETIETADSAGESSGTAAASDGPADTAVPSETPSEAASGEITAGGGIAAGAGVGTGGGASMGPGTTSAEDQDDPTPGGNIDVDAQSGAGSKTPMASIIYRGRLKLMNDELIFTPCGGDFSVRLMSGRYKMADWAETARVHLEAGVYAEFRAEVGEPSEGDTRLLLSEPLFIANEGASCEHPTPVGSLVASGNEPFWTLIVGETHTILTTPKGEWRLTGGMHPDDAFFNVPSGTRSMSLIDQEQNLEISLVVHKKPCHDTMVDAWSAYTAEFEYQGEKGTGCARPGRFLPPFHGQYGVDLASGSDLGRSIRLTLSEGGLASLTDASQSGKPTVKYMGLWEMRDRSTVEVQFMTQDGVPNFERLVLTGDRNVMTAVEFNRKLWGDQGLKLARIVN